MVVLIDEEHHNDIVCAFLKKAEHNVEISWFVSLDSYYSVPWIWFQMDGLKIISKDFEKQIRNVIANIDKDSLRRVRLFNVVRVKFFCCVSACVCLTQRTTSSPHSRRDASQRPVQYPPNALRSQEERGFQQYGGLQPAELSIAGTFPETLPDPSVVLIISRDVSLWHVHIKKNRTDFQSLRDMKLYRFFQLSHRRFERLPATQTFLRFWDW